MNPNCTCNRNNTISTAAALQARALWSVGTRCPSVFGSKGCKCKGSVHTLAPRFLSSSFLQHKILSAAFSCETFQNKSIFHIPAILSYTLLHVVYWFSPVKHCAQHPVATHDHKQRESPHTLSIDDKCNLRLERPAGLNFAHYVFPSSGSGRTMGCIL